MQISKSALPDEIGKLEKRASNHGALLSADMAYTVPKKDYNRSHP